MRVCGGEEAMRIKGSLKRGLRELGIGVQVVEHEPSLSKALVRDPARHGPSPKLQSEHIPSPTRSGPWA